MERRNGLTLEPQDPEFIAAAFTDASRNRRMIESRRLDIVIDGRPLRYWWRDWEQPEWQEEIPVADLVTKLSPLARRSSVPVRRCIPRSLHAWALLLPSRISCQYFVSRSVRRCCAAETVEASAWSA